MATEASEKFYFTQQDIVLIICMDERVHTYMFTYIQTCLLPACLPACLPLACMLAACMHKLLHKVIPTCKTLNPKPMPALCECVSRNPKPTNQTLGADPLTAPSPCIASSGRELKFEEQPWGGGELPEMTAPALGRVARLRRQGDAVFRYCLGYTGIQSPLDRSKS